MFFPCCCFGQKRTNPETPETATRHEPRPGSVSRGSVGVSTPETSGESWIRGQPWLNRLFGYPVNKKGKTRTVGGQRAQSSAPSQRREAFTENQPASSESAGIKKTNDWFNKLVMFFKRSTIISLLEEFDKKEQETCQSNMADWLKDKDPEKYKNSTDPEPQIPGQVGSVHIFKRPGTRQSWFGFPNPAQFCYMISSLQSLLTLTNFIRDICRQEDLWNSVLEAKLLRAFMGIIKHHRSMNATKKLQALLIFKATVAVHDSEFSDLAQKDAHEFLASVLNHIRNLRPQLMDFATRTGKVYKCPVQDHMEFMMQDTRTCKRCGASSTKIEDFTNLSLNLLSAGSVNDMLQDYMKESVLEYRCHCGGTTSGLQSSFMTLPRVLTLHVKRFSFNSFRSLQKLSNKVWLSQELQVKSGLVDGHYKLVSVISHLGSGANSGHYVSEGIHPEANPDDPTNPWLIFNDSQVTETTEASVCKQRKRSAYILFYQKKE